MVEQSIAYFINIWDIVTQVAAYFSVYWVPSYEHYFTFTSPSFHQVGLFEQVIYSWAGLYCLQCSTAQQYIAWVYQPILPKTMLTKLNLVYMIQLSVEYSSVMFVTVCQISIEWNEIFNNYCNIWPTIGLVSVLHRRVVNLIILWHSQGHWSGFRPNI